VTGARHRANKKRNQARIDLKLISVIADGMRGYMRLKYNLAFALALMLAPAFSFGQESATKPDNTRVNKQDRQSGQPTADQQKSNASDRQLAKDIRKAIISDKSLSTYAHNVKVIAQNGTVTLKGPVRSDEEKKSVEEKAAQVAGANNVQSQLSVAPKGKS
jgi:hyperosmotically inducible protein